MTAARPTAARVHGNAGPAHKAAAHVHDTADPVHENSEYAS
ncbi:hypothetical protein [Streptomyces sp. bgisy082]